MIKLSGGNEDREMFIFPVQLAVKRIGNLTGLIRIMCAICDDHTISGGLFSALLIYITTVLYFIYYLLRYLTASDHFCIIHARYILAKVSVGEERRTLIDPL